MHGIKQPTAQRYYWVYLVGLVVSILLSTWESMRVTVINPDAICYLQSAQSMTMGLHVAMHLCDQAHWPFYSLLIYATSALTKFSLLNTAFLLDGLFSAISVLTFIAIARFFKDSMRVMWLAALVILLAHEFNVLREAIIRDHGFWAFYLVSVLALLHFVREPRWFYALAWSASLFVAALFRIEGVIFLVALPFVAMFSSAQRFRAFLTLNALLIITIVVASGWLLNHPELSTTELGRIAELKFQLINGLKTIVLHFKASSQAISAHALNKYSAHDSMLVFFFVLVGWYGIYLVKNISFIYAALVIFAWTKKVLLPEKKLTRVLWAYILLNIIITTGFLVENNFLSKRYLIALSLTLMIWVPFALNYLFEQKQKILVWLVILVIIASSIGGIVSFGYSKKYIRDAGDWLERNLPQNASLYSNDYQVMYYSQRFGNDIFTKAREFIAPATPVAMPWQHYDYAALRMSKAEREQKAEQIKKLGTPVAQFINKRGDEVAIYRIK